MDRVTLVLDSPVMPCSPSPCGPNTICRVVHDIAVCECMPGFEGSPSTSGCHPECVINADCPRHRACVNNKCVDPCPGVCGYKAVCQTLNHSPVCSCPPPLVGDAFVECKDIPGTWLSSSIWDSRTWGKKIKKKKLKLVENWKPPIFYSCIYFWVRGRKSRNFE